MREFDGGWGTDTKPNAEIQKLTEQAQTTDRLKALADLLPILEAADFSPGEWIFPSDTSDKCSRIPFRQPSAAAQGFLEMIHADGWVTQFDWPAWVQTREAEALFAEDGLALAQANADQLSKMLTVCVRRDRFTYGDHLLTDLETGLITRIVRRAHHLARDAD